MEAASVLIDDASLIDVLAQIELEQAASKRLAGVENQMSSDNELRCYSDRAAAELLGCSRRHIVALRARGLLPFVKVGRRIVIRHADLAAFLEENRAVQRPDATAIETSLRRAG